MLTHRIGLSSSFRVYLFPIHLGGATYLLYIGLIAVAANIVVTFAVSILVPGRRAATA
jgi:SSS family solute:Na+ symporter